MKHGALFRVKCVVSPSDLFQLLVAPTYWPIGFRKSSPASKLDTWGLRGEGLRRQKDASVRA